MSEFLREPAPGGQDNDDGDGDGDDEPGGTDSDDDDDHRAGTWWRNSEGVTSSSRTWVDIKLCHWVPKVPFLHEM